MIRSFRDKDTGALFNDVTVRCFTAIERPARRKLLYLHRARVVHDLTAPPGNRLEALRGDRRGQRSIRINDQWRICFTWRGGDAHDVVQDVQPRRPPARAPQLGGGPARRPRRNSRHRGHF
jgi:toxin HigB-1